LREAPGDVEKALHARRDDPVVLLVKLVLAAPLRAALAAPAGTLLRAVEVERGLLAEGLVQEVAAGVRHDGLELPERGVPGGDLAEDRLVVPPRLALLGGDVTASGHREEPILGV